MRMGLSKIRSLVALGGHVSAFIPFYEPADLQHPALREGLPGGVGAAVLQSDFGDYPAGWQHVSALRTQTSTGIHYILPAYQYQAGDYIVSGKVQITLGNLPGIFAVANGTHRVVLWVLGGWTKVCPTYQLFFGPFTPSWRVSVTMGGVMRFFTGPVRTVLPDGAYTEDHSPPEGATCQVAGGEASWWDQPT